MKAVNSAFTLENSDPGIRFSALILAAGASARMGADKALLPFDNVLTFSNYLVNSYIEALARPVILVVNESYINSDPLPGMAKVVINREVELGRSHSIRLGIINVPGGNACFIQNVDNPYIDQELLKLMLSRLQPDSFVVPVVTGRGGHPVLLGPQIVDYLKSFAEWCDFRSVLNDFVRIAVPWNNERILWNINTPEDYKGFILLNTK